MVTQVNKDLLRLFQLLLQLKVVLISNEQILSKLKEVGFSANVIRGHRYDDMGQLQCM